MDAYVAPPRVNVLGVGISVLNLDTVVPVLDSALRSGQRGYITVTGVHGVIESQDDEALRRIHNASLLTTPDGMPMVWMGRFAGHGMMGRVYGPDLMERVFEWSRTRGVTHYFYGGQEGVVEVLSQRLAARFPGLRIVGTFTPPFRPLTDAERDALVAEVARVRPDFFWVGLSTPKQERFMAAHRDLLEARFLVGVGAAFDFFAGRVRQAPRWVQRSGFEWLYRLAMDFRRLWPRYSRIVPRFLWKAGWQLAGRRPPPLDTPVESVPPVPGASRNACP
ncbi:MAG: WecB/TagA/CpsF family glycosyltransferase [Verrucomicrobiae bacterium]|nr:WecB/TagA/CpsF family glycosyltransferase [Verrucomicrobiae bacterium]